MPASRTAARLASATFVLSSFLPGLVAAAPVTWNLAGDNSYDAQYGSVPRTVTNAGQTLSITGWAAPGPGDPLSQAYLGAYTNGMGVVSRPITGPNDYGVDNIGPYELVAIHFASGLTTLSGIELTPYAAPSFRLWAGVLPGTYPGALGTLSITGLDLMSGWVVEQDYACTVDCSPTATFGFSGLAPVNWLLIAAAPGAPAGSAAFKILSIEGTPESAAVPVPATVALLGVGLVAFGVPGLRRRAGIRTAR